MEVALKKQSEIQQIIVNAIASERSAVLQLASDFRFDGNAVCVSFEIILLRWSKRYQVTIMSVVKRHILKICQFEKEEILFHFWACHWWPNSSWK